MAVAVHEYLRLVWRFDSEAQRGEDVSETHRTLKIGKWGRRLDLPQCHKPAMREGDVSKSGATAMNASIIAKQHLDLAIQEAKKSGFDADSTARYMLGWVVSKYLEYRPVADVRAELQFVADNCDPDGDYVFMRP
jgi:hypothetical protein